MIDHSQKKATFTSPFGGFSSQYIHMDSPSFLIGRSIVDVCFSSILPHLMLTAHGPLTATDTTSDRAPFGADKGIVCLWNLNDPSLPLKYENSISCFRWDPPNAFLGFMTGFLSVKA
jgi:hypothetical protein